MHDRCVARCELFYSFFPWGFGSVWHYVAWRIAVDALCGSRTGSVNLPGEHCRDESESGSRSSDSAPGTGSIEDASSKPPPAQSDTDEQAAWPDPSGASRGKTRKLLPGLREESQVLRYNTDRFWHILVLPLRCQVIEGEGEDFLRSGQKNFDTIRCNQTSKHSLRILTLAPSQPSFSARILQLKRLLGKRIVTTRVDRKPNHFFFQVVGDFNRATTGEFN